MQSKNQIARSYLLEADKAAREMIYTLDKGQMEGLMEKAITIRHHILIATELLGEEDVNGLFPNQTR